MIIDVSWVTRSKGMVRRSGLVVTPLVVIFLMPELVDLVWVQNIRNEIVIVSGLSFVVLLIFLYNTLGRYKTYIKILTPIGFSFFFLSFSIL
jgi:hypothetical protein